MFEITRLNSYVSICNLLNVVVISNSRRFINLLEMIHRYFLFQIIIISTGYENVSPKFPEYLHFDLTKTNRTYCKAFDEVEIKIYQVQIDEAKFGFLGKTNLCLTHELTTNIFSYIIYLLVSM